MGWTPGKKRKTAVAEVMEELREEVKSQGLSLHAYTAQPRDPQTPKRYTLMVHGNPEKPIRAHMCDGPGCSWFGRKKGHEGAQAYVLRQLLDSLSDQSWGDFHSETFKETKRRNK